MGTNFAVGDKVRILEGNGFDGETGEINRDAGFLMGGTRKLNEGYKKPLLHFWLVMLDDTAKLERFPEGALEKIT